MNKNQSSQNQGKFCAFNSRFGGLLSVGTVALMLAASQAQAAGFEKAVWWDAHYAAIGGAAQSSVQGPQALYWNPAALAGIQGVQINGDFSPTWAQYSGPMALTYGNATSSTTAQNSNTTLAPVGAAFVGYGITPQWGVGVGYYVSAGSRADYDSVTPNAALGVTYAPPLKADLTVTELSAGTGYEILPGLKLGAAYRLTFVHATLDEAGTSTIAGSTVLLSNQISGISATKSGFRVGLEYAPKDSPWGVGVTYRNQVKFAANGNATSYAAAASGNPLGLSASGGQIGTSTAVVSSSLPQSFDAAAHYHFSPTITGFAGYTFTNYSQDQTLGVAGVGAGALGTLSNSTTDIPLGWTNMHDVRVGADYDGFVNWPIRVGFVWTSQVTSAVNALPILPAPGNGYTVIAGTGHEIIPNLTIDGAVEYSWDSGSVTAANNPASTTAQGNYSANATVVHLSGTYTF